jgi:hypothetical protein
MVPVNVEAKINVKRSVEANARSNMTMNRNEDMKEYEFGHESRHECKEKSQNENEAEHNAVNGKEMLTIGRSPRKLNQGHGGRSGRQHVRLLYTMDATGPVSRERCG